MKKMNGVIAALVVATMTGCHTFHAGQDVRMQPFAEMAKAAAEQDQQPITSPAGLASQAEDRRR